MSCLTDKDVCEPTTCTDDRSSHQQQAIHARIREIDQILAHWFDPGGSVSRWYVCTACCCAYEKQKCSQSGVWKVKTGTFYCDAWRQLKPEQACVKECLVNAHEPTHRQQCEAHNGFGEQADEYPSEEAAYGAEKQCLQNLLNNAGDAGNPRASSR